ncbi:MAG TPA: NAD(P)H-dependent oxidoreductase [Sphingobium sp.]
MNVLIIYAHHDPNSLARAMRDRALDVLASQGHETRVSDLHAMKFKAVADDADFTTPRADSPGALTSYQARQKAAAGDGSFAPDILKEHENLVWADAVLFVFPYYFFNMPAILKGWCERVIVYGIHYDSDHPTIGAYATGGLRGKRALIGMSSGAPPPPGNAGVSRHHERIEAMQNGSLNYCGFDVMVPFIAWGVPYIGHDRLVAYLDQWEGRVRNLFTDAPEIRGAEGPTPAPEMLTGRARAPGDRVWPYGGDKAIAEKVILVKLTARNGEVETLIGKLKTYVEAAVNDIGARIYSLLRSPERADEVWLIESYADGAAHERHTQSPPFRDIATDVGDLLAKAPEITALRPEFSKGL